MTFSLKDTLEKGMLMLPITEHLENLKRKRIIVRRYVLVSKPQLFEHLTTVIHKRPNY